jgi:thioredoxin 1
MGTNVNELSDAAFEEKVMKSDKPVLVDFWAEWCGPCKAIAPVVDELAGEYKGKVDFYKINVDHNRSTPGMFGVRGIPTLILFKGGKVVGQEVGAVAKSRIEELVKKGL